MLTGKPRVVGVGRGLPNCRSVVLLMFSKYGRVCNSNEAEVQEILKGLGLFTRRYSVSPIVESDSSNAIALVSNEKANCWRF